MQPRLQPPKTNALQKRQLGDTDASDKPEDSDAHDPRYHVTIIDLERFWDAGKPPSEPATDKKEFSRSSTPQSPAAQRASS